MESKTWHNRLGITGTKTDLPAGDRAKPGVGDVPDELYKEKGSERRRHGAREVISIFN